MNDKLKKGKYICNIISEPITKLDIVSKYNKFT